MDHNTDKHLEKLVDKMMKDVSLEKPSFDFTDNVMSQVLNIKTSQATVYKPLISKKVWFLVFVGILSLVVFSVFGTQTENSSWLSSFDFNVFDNIKIRNLFSGFSLSKTTMYAIVLFGFMVCAQIPFLKHRFNQRLEEH